MKKVMSGVIVSVNMQDTVVVNIATKVAHPLYRKLIKKDKKIKADSAKLSLKVGDKVKIVETKPISATKHFKVMEVLKNGSA